LRVSGNDLDVESAARRLSFGQMSAVLAAPNPGGRRRAPRSDCWSETALTMTKGESTRGGLDIEIVPGDAQIKLIVPMKGTKKPGEE